MSFGDLRPGHVAGFLASGGDPSRLWFLHHIPKTAGSSLAHEMATYLKPYRNLGIDYSPETRVTGDKTTASVNQFLAAHAIAPYRCASGHILPPHVEMIAHAIPDTGFVTFLRHPTARVLSEYFYCRSEAHPPWRDFIERYPTLADFVDNPAEGNKMCSYLFGPEAISDQDAVAQLLSRYAFVGLQERYPLSFRLMSQLLWGGSQPRVRSRVTAEIAGTPPEPSAEIKARIVAANARDLALYTAVSEVYAAIADEAWRADLTVRTAAG